MSQLVDYLRAFGRFQRNARLYLLITALSGVTSGVIIVLYNLYLSALGYGADFIGLVLFVGAIGAGLAIFPAGVCVDRFGGRIVIVGSNLVVAVAIAGQILFRQPLPLLITGFMAGVALAFAFVVNAPYLIANSTPDERAQLFSLNIVLTVGTNLIGEPLGGALPGWFRSMHWLMGLLPHWMAAVLASQPEPRSYQLALLFAGILAAPTLIPLFMLSDDRPRELAPRGERGNAGMPFTVSLLASLPRWRRRLTLRKVIVHPVFTMLLVQVFIGLGSGLLSPYFNLYFVQHLHASPALFGTIDGAANGINALLTLLAPWLALKIGRVNTITFTRLLSIPLLLTIGLTNRLPLAAFLYLFRQGAMDMSLGVFQVYSMEVAPKGYRGLANSSYQVAAQAVPAVTLALGGLMIARVGYVPVFITTATLYLLGIATLWLRFRGERESQEVWEP